MLNGTILRSLVSFLKRFKNSFNVCTMLAWLNNTFFKKIAWKSLTIKSFIKIVYTVLLRVSKNFYKHSFLPLAFKKIGPLTSESAPLSLSLFIHTCTSTSTHTLLSTDWLSSRNVCGIHFNFTNEEKIISVKGGLFTPFMEKSVSPGTLT